MVLFAVTPVASEAPTLMKPGQPDYDPLRARGRPILIGYNASAAARRAVEVVAMTAPGVPVFVACVCQESLVQAAPHLLILDVPHHWGPPSPGDWADAAAADGADYATRLGLAARPISRCSVAAPPEILAALATEIDAALIVVGRGRGGLRRCLSPGLVAPLLRLADRPVSVISANPHR